VHPVLWHIKVSPYSEKARWALDYKQVSHSRRPVDGDGTHPRLAQGLTNGQVRTMPVLVIDGQGIGDSTTIIGALEALWPERPLYPAQRATRLRALALEEFFDEEFAPHLRLAGISQMAKDPELFVQLFFPDAPRKQREAVLSSFARVRDGVFTAFGIDEHSVDRAYEKIAQAGERLRAELGANGYLDAGGFGLADLTLAGLAGSIVAPDAFPYPEQAAGRHPLLEPVLDELKAAGIFAWVREIYERHRGSSAEVPALAA
jgi:glutathione S-transferase